MVSGDGTDRSRQTGVVGLLALQGSFLLHRRSLERLGVATREVRKVDDLRDIAALIIPGGESTTMENLAKRFGLFDAIRELGRDGLPIFGTCAGAILLGHGDERPERLQIVDVDVQRNAYGTQIDSFNAELDLAPLERPFHGVFIRAPKLEARPGASDVEVLGANDGSPVLIRAGNCLLATFHPELTDDTRVHRYFLGLSNIDVPAGENAEGTVEGTVVESLASSRST
jgi:5'-phosphate synthase pdxT subunit